MGHINKILLLILLLIITLSTTVNARISISDCIKQCGNNEACINQCSSDGEPNPCYNQDLDEDGDGYCSPAFLIRECDKSNICNEEADECPTLAGDSEARPGCPICANHITMGTECDDPDPEDVTCGDQPQEDAGKIINCEIEEQDVSIFCSMTQTEEDCDWEAYEAVDNAVASSQIYNNGDIEGIKTVYESNNIWQVCDTANQPNNPYYCFTTGEGIDAAYCCDEDDSCLGLGLNSHKISQTKANSYMKGLFGATTNGMTPVGGEVLFKNAEGNIDEVFLKQGEEIRLRVKLNPSIIEDVKIELFGEIQEDEQQYTCVEDGGECQPSTCQTGYTEDTTKTCETGDVCCKQSTTTDTCSDNELNGDETDIDCGGSTCQNCDIGDKCIIANDCSTGYCNNGVCVIREIPPRLPDPMVVKDLTGNTVYNTPQEETVDSSSSDSSSPIGEGAQNNIIFYDKFVEYRLPVEEDGLYKGIKITPSDAVEKISMLEIKRTNTKYCKDGTWINSAQNIEKDICENTGSSVEINKYLRSGSTGICCGRQDQLTLKYATDNQDGTDFDYACHNNVAFLVGSPQKIRITSNKLEKTLVSPALLPSKNGYYVCGGADGVAPDALTYTKKDVCDRVTMQVGPVEKTYECAPITDAGLTLYKWVDVTDDLAFNNVYQDVPLMGILSGELFTYSTSGNLICKNGDEKTIDCDNYPIYTSPTMQCGENGLVEIDSDIGRLAIDIAFPVDIMIDDLAAGIEENMIEMKVRVNDAAGGVGQDIPAKKVEYEVYKKDDTTVFLNGVVCDEETSDQPGGETCEDSTSCAQEQGYECIRVMPEDDYGVCQLSTGETQITTPVCEPEGNLKKYFLPKGEYIFKYLVEVSSEDERKKTFHVKIDTEGMYNYDFTQQGGCVNKEECFYGYENNEPRCEEQGFYDKDYACLQNNNKGEWGTRTGLLATVLKNHAENKGKPFSIDCNNPESSVNEYIATGEETNFCILNIYNNEEVEDTIIGVGLEQDITEPGNDIATVFEAMDIGKVRIEDGKKVIKDCSLGIIDDQEDEFKKCSNKVWYYPKMKLVIFSKEGFTLSNSGFFGTVVDFIKGIFGIETQEFIDLGMESEPISKRANKIYFANNQEKYVYGGFEYFTYEQFGAQESLVLATKAVGNICPIYEANKDDDDEAKCNYDSASDKVIFVNQDANEDALKKLTVPIRFFKD